MNKWKTLKVEIINLPKILRSKNIYSKMPYHMSKDDISMVTYKLQQSIRFKLLKHKEIVDSFEIKSFIQNASVLPRPCENPPYIDPEHGHTSTGELRILKNNKDKRLITKGPK